MNKQHIKEFAVRYASEVTSRPDFYVTRHRLDRTSAGQTGHFHGTNGTRPRDGCNPKVEVSRQISLCLLVFSRPKLGGLSEGSIAIC